MKDKIYKSLDYLSLLTGYRPKVKKHDLQNLLKKENKGGVVISADFELAWAFRYSKKVNNPEKMAQQARQNFPTYLKLFDEYNIPITWATVGHLMIESCNKGDHDWMHRLPYFGSNHKWAFTSGDWFDCDPYTNYKKNNSWYAPDLIEAIQKSKVNHEIGCHTFSHIDFSDENCPSTVAEDEIKACLSAAEPWGIKLQSMVFPGGTYGNIEILKKYGISTYRRNFKEKLAIPYKDKDNLIVSHTTQMIGLSNPNYSVQFLAFRIIKMIQKAIFTNTVAHLWFHPSDPAAIEILTILLPKITKLRENNKLWIGRMNDLKKII